MEKLFPPTNWHHYFPFLDSNSVGIIEKLPELYHFWNSQINVISRKDENQIWRNHIIHSLVLANVIPLENNMKVIDIGTGGGFPGIPLAIAFPNIHFTLVDSIGKKIKVVKAIVDHLNLENVYPVHNRVDNLMDQYNYAITRAVAPVKNLVSLTEKLWINKDDARIYALKGGDLTNEIKGYETQLYSLDKWLPQTYFNHKFIVEIKIF
ncbi:MAG: 16S rRNA (guanine(527)-N(7))-methyltransferase RsmG [Schleiferiaceae bacterium]